MRSQRILTLVQIVFAGIGLYVLAQVSGAQPDWLATITFAAAYTILGVFGVLLPRGDLTDMTGTIAFAAGLLLAPLPAAGAILGARVLILIAKRGRVNGWSVVDEATRQVLAMAWTGAVFWLMAGGVSLLAPSIQAYAYVAFAAALFLCLDFVLAQAESTLRFGTSFLGLVAGNLRLQGWMLAAQWSAAVLAVVNYAAMGTFGLLVVVALLLVMRQSFALLVEVRAAYRSTVEVLARAMEAEDPRRRGHGERVALLAREVGRVLGIHGAELEDLNYAALFHDVGKIGQEPIIGFDEIGSSADVLASAGFLSDAVPILRVLEAAPHEPFGSESEAVLVGAYIVARASELDDVYRIADTIGPPLSVSIGARLYVETRRGIDQAIHRVESRLRSGRLTLEAPVEEAV